MTTKKITLNELRSIVKQIIKEVTDSKIESVNDYINRVGRGNLPKPKYSIGDRVLVDMGDGSQEALTISKISYFKPPKSNFSYSYRSKEYSKTEPDMIHLEDDIITKI